MECWFDGVKLEKCMFLRKKIKYLSVKITQDGIKTDTEKIEAIMSMIPPTPSKNCKQVATFLGMATCFLFRNCVNHSMALKRKRVKFVWSSGGSEVF